MAHGAYVDPAGSQTLFRDYAEQLRTAQVHRPTATAAVETFLRLHAYPRLGGRPIGSIRPSEIQVWVKALTGVLAPATVELVYRCVSAIFTAAVGDRLIASSPCIRIALPKRNDAEVVPLTVTEVEALAAAVRDRYRALIVFAAGMGLRQGECFGLTVDQVDFLRRRVARYRPRQFALVFANSWCNSLRRSSVGEMWRRDRKQSGLPEWATFHDL